MKSTIIAIAVSLLAVVIAVISVGTKANAPTLGAAIGAPNYITKMNTSDPVTVTSSGVRVLATSTSRTFAEITATSTTGVYCNLSDAKPSLQGGGVMVALGQPLVLANDNLYIGSVRCIAPANTSVAVVQN